jgi:hypothetical protein
VLDRCFRRLGAALCLALAALAVPPRAQAAECRVPTGDYCVCCPPSDCRKEESFCPGGAGGALVLKAQNPACAVGPLAGTTCASGGVIASERTSVVGVYPQGQRARVELSQQQLAELVGQLEGLRR